LSVRLIPVRDLFGNGGFRTGAVYEIYNHGKEKIGEMKYGIYGQKTVEHNTVQAETDIQKQNIKGSSHKLSVSHSREFPKIVFVKFKFGVIIKNVEIFIFHTGRASFEISLTLLHLSCNKTKTEQFREYAELLCQVYLIMVSPFSQSCSISSC